MPAWAKGKSVVLDMTKTHIRLALKEEEDKPILEVCYLSVALSMIRSFSKHCSSFHLSIHVAIIHVGSGGSCLHYIGTRCEIMFCRLFERSTRVFFSGQRHELSKENLVFP